MVGALLVVGVFRVGAAEAGPPGVAEDAVPWLLGALVVGLADPVAVGLGVGVGDFDVDDEDPNPSDVREPVPSVPPVRFEIDSPVSSSKLRMTIMAITKIAPETVAIHFQGSRARASRHGARPSSWGSSSSSMERVVHAGADPRHPRDGGGLRGLHAFTADPQRVGVDRGADGGDHAADGGTDDRAGDPDGGQQDGGGDRGQGTGHDLDDVDVDLLLVVTHPAQCVGSIKRADEPGWTAAWGRFTSAAARS